MSMFRKIVDKLTSAQSRNYIIALFFIAIVALFSHWLKGKFGEQVKRDEYDLVKEYLLNDSPLQGHTKPKIWIHSTHEINARDWKKNMFRNSTTDNNQSYIILAVQSVINHCGDDFHICLIDDQSFAKLIPTWDVDLAAVPDPLKMYVREIGMLQLMYFYGGIRVPNTFLCLQSLLPLYTDYIGATNSMTTEPTDMYPQLKHDTKDMPFLVEHENRHRQFNGPTTFIPSTAFMGAVKNSRVVKVWINHMKEKIKSGHVSGDVLFTGEFDKLGADYVATGQALLVDGQFFGVKDQAGKAISADKLLGQQYLNISPDITMYGIWIPGDDMHNRIKCRWFIHASAEEILHGNFILAKYFKMSMVDVAHAVTIPSSD